MTVDYDLVVIGASAAGIAAAKTAARYHARVALVQQGEIYNALPACVALLRQQAAQHDPEGNPPNFFEVAHLLEILTLQQQAIDSFDGLATMGIDVIANSGAFYRKPRLGFAIAERSLTARAYLVALSLHQSSEPQKSKSQVAESPPIWDLAMLPDRLGQLQQAHHVLIRGTSLESVAIAQALARLGKQVTLIEFGKAFLSEVTSISAEYAQRLQVLLEAVGVSIYLEDQPINADVILQGHTDRQLDTAKLNPDNLNLGSAKVRWNRDRILVDRHGRASRKVYVASGNESTQAVATTHHALKLPWQPPTNLPQVSTVLTGPECVTIGLTLRQAQRKYGKVYCLEQSLNQFLKAQMCDQDLGSCQLIVRSNGVLVGAQIMATQASELVGVLSLAIQQQLSVNTIADMALAEPTIAQCLRQAAAQYRVQSRRSRLWRYGLEEFFALRRYWAR